MPKTGELTSDGESGGLDEATSDIFGSMVEFAANNAADPGDRLIGGCGAEYQAEYQAVQRAWTAVNVPGADAACA